jgi:hypothetical protein
MRVFAGRWAVEYITTGLVCALISAWTNEKAADGRITKLKIIHYR